MSPAWLRIWQVGRIDLSSPLPVDQAEERLRSGLTDRRAWTLPLVPPPEGRVAVGTVRNRKLRLTTQYGMRDGARPRLTGRLTATADGCRLTGRLGLMPFARVLLLVGIVGLVAAALVTAVLLVVSLVQGGGAGGRLFAFAVPSVLATVFVGGALTQSTEGLADGEFLHDWVRERLQAR